MTQVNAGAGDTPNRLFSGFDSVARGMLPTTVVAGEYEEDGTSTRLSIAVCRSVRELKRALAIDSKLSISFLKSFNATAKMNFMNSLNVTETNVAIVVYVVRGLGEFRVRRVALEPGFKPPTDEKGVADFVRVNGDSYVSKASRGGEYYGVYTFRTTSRTEQSSLTAELSAKGIKGGLTVEGGVQVKLTDFLEETEVSYTFDQEMTGVTGTALPNQDEMIDFALEFSEMDMDSPVTTDIAISPYEGVPGFGNVLRKVRANSRLFTDENGFLANLARVRSLRDQIDRLKAIYDVYGFRDDHDLDALRPKAETDRKTVERQIHDWEDDSTGDFAEPALPSLARGEPVLTFEAHQPAAFGSETGPNFEFKRVGAALRDHVRIESIQLADGKWGSRGQYHVIRRLIVGYASDKKDWVETHGQEGDPRGELQLEKGDFPLRFQIGHGGLVDSIEVESRTKTIKAGGPNGTISHWKPEKDAVVLGFAGRAGGAVDQIRIVHATLKPAKYVRAN